MSPPTEPELRDSLVALEHYFREKHEHFETFPESASAKQGAAYLDAADRLGAILEREARGGEGERAGGGGGGSPMNAKQRRGTKAMVAMYLRWKKTGVGPRETCPLCEIVGCDECPDFNPSRSCLSPDVRYGSCYARRRARVAGNTIKWHELTKQCQAACNRRLALHRKRLREDAKRRKGA